MGWVEFRRRGKPLPRTDKNTGAGDQTITLTHGEVEALYLCVYTALDPRFPTDEATMRQAETALNREVTAFK